MIASDTVIPENLPVLELRVRIVALEAELAAEREDSATMRKYLSIPDGARLNPDYAALGSVDGNTFNPLWKLRCDVEQLQSALATMTKARDELETEIERVYREGIE